MTTKKTNSRERVLLNILPAALVLAVYAFLLAMPIQKEHQITRTKFDAAKSLAVPESVADQSRQNLELAQAGLTKLNTQIKIDREQISFLGKQWSNGDARLTTVQQVTELLQQFNLSIVKQEFEESPSLSSYLKNLEEIVGKYSNEDETHDYWRIELAGGYPDMMKFLFEIKSSGLRTFPLTLTMTASEQNDGIHTWSVVFVV